MIEKNKHRVIVLTLEIEAEYFQVNCNLSVELAKKGHTIGLWIPELDYPAALERLFELQLEIEQAGGISLVHGGLDEKPLDWAIEAFGRVDLLVQPGKDHPAKIESLEYLKKAARPSIINLAEWGSGIPLVDGIMTALDPAEPPLG
jgi:hypothetical protein